MFIINLFFSERTGPSEKSERSVRGTHRVGYAGAAHHWDLLICIIHYSMQRMKVMNNFWKAK